MGAPGVHGNGRTFDEALPGGFARDTKLMCGAIAIEPESRARRTTAGVDAVVRDGEDVGTIGPRRLCNRDQRADGGASVRRGEGLGDALVPIPGEVILRPGHGRRLGGAQGECGEGRCEECAFHCGERSPIYRPGVAAVGMGRKDVPVVDASYVVVGYLPNDTDAGTR